MKVFLNKTLTASCVCRFMTQECTTMADNDLQAELDNLFGSNEAMPPAEEKAAAAEAPAAEAQCTETTPAEEQAPKTPAAAPKGKPMMGSKGGGARPLGSKGFPKNATVAGGLPTPAPDAAAPAPTAAATPAAPAVAPVPAIAPVATRSKAPAESSSKLPLILSGLSLLFTLVCIIMVNNVGSKVSALQTAIEAQSRAQLDILNKQTKALNEQTVSIKKFEKILEDQLLRKDSDFQKRMRIVSDALEELKEVLPKK